MAKQLWHIQHCRLFEALDAQQTQWLEARCRSRTFPAKSPIYLPADQGECVFFLASGRAKICHLTTDGKQSILAFVEPGELFGELALIEPGQREEYAEAIDRSLAVMIPGEVMHELMRRQPEISLGITRLIGLRRRRIENRLKNLLFLSNRQRLTHLLLELAEQYGVRQADGVHLSVKLSHQDLANVIGSTRETVTVMLGELQQDGLVTVGRRKVCLRDPGRLAQSVQRPSPQLPDGARRRAGPLAPVAERGTL